MAIKMRFLYYSKKKKFADIGAHIKQKYELPINAVDRIPPAYSCDKERLVVLGISANNSIPDDLRLFCRELTKVRAANVCLIMDGNETAAALVLDNLKQAGTTVVGKTLYIKGGNFLFGGKLTPEETEQIDKWLDENIANLK